MTRIFSPIQRVNGHLKKWFHNTILTLSFFFLATHVAFSASNNQSTQNGELPGITIKLPNADEPSAFTPALKIVLILTILAVAPAILLMMTSFTRILIVLSFVRQALGSPTMPPNQVLVGLSLFITFFTMSPIWDKIKTEGIDPYSEGKLSQEETLEKISVPLKKFMLSETREDDLGLFYNVSKLEKPKSKDDIPFSVVMPAFMISELKTAFQIGFLVYIPFLIIDMVISSILMAMGMLMLPPTVVSLPFKLVLFVLVDGWSLIVGSLVHSFRMFH